MHIYQQFVFKDAIGIKCDLQSLSLNQPRDDKIPPAFTIDPDELVLSPPLPVDGGENIDTFAIRLKQVSSANTSHANEIFQNPGSHLAIPARTASCSLICDGRSSDCQCARGDHSMSSCRPRQCSFDGPERPSKLQRSFYRIWQAITGVLFFTERDNLEPNDRGSESNPHNESHSHTKVMVPSENRGKYPNLLQTVLSN